MLDKLFFHVLIFRIIFQKESLKKYKEENLRLQSQIKEMNERFASQEVLQTSNANGSDQNKDEGQTSSVNDKSDSSVKQKLEDLLRENESLTVENQHLTETLDSIQQKEISLSGIPDNTKEKMRHLEELLEKRKDVEEESSTKDGDSADNDIEGISFIFERFYFWL